MNRKVDSVPSFEGALGVLDMLTKLLQSPSLVLGSVYGDTTTTLFPHYYLSLSLSRSTKALILLLL